MLQGLGKSSFGTTICLRVVTSKSCGLEREFYRPVSGNHRSGVSAGVDPAATIRHSTPCGHRTFGAQRHQFRGIGRPENFARVGIVRSSVRAEREGFSAIGLLRVEIVVSEKGPPLSIGRFTIGPPASLSASGWCRFCGRLWRFAVDHGQADFGFASNTPSVFPLLSCTFQTWPVNVWRETVSPRAEFSVGNGFSRTVHPEEFDFLLRAIAECNVCIVGGVFAGIGCRAGFELVLRPFVFLILGYFLRFTS